MQNYRQNYRYVLSLYFSIDTDEKAKYSELNGSKQALNSICSYFFVSAILICKRRSKTFILGHVYRRINQHSSWYEFVLHSGDASAYPPLRWSRQSPQSSAIKLNHQTGERETTTNHDNGPEVMSTESVRGGGLLSQPTHKTRRVVSPSVGIYKTFFLSFVFPFTFFLSVTNSFAH